MNHLLVLNNQQGFDMLLNKETKPNQTKPNHSLSLSLTLSIYLSIYLYIYILL